MTKVQVFIYNLFMIKSKLKEILIEKNITQRELAKKVGITESAVSRFINKNRIPTGENMLKIANILGVKVEELYKV